MPPPEDRKVQAVRVMAEWWSDRRTRQGRLATAGEFARKLWEFALASTPEQRRRRFGDVDFDFDYKVNTTAGTLSWRDRLMGSFTSEYQATDPVLFREMLGSLKLDYARFTFIDLGSGKGRTLLMAAEYPFRRIIGVELLPSLHRIAQENVRNCKSPSRKCFAIETVCADARAYDFPDEPLVIYLFNPFLESVLAQVWSQLDASLARHPRPVCVLYHNPLLRNRLTQSGAFGPIAGTSQYCVLANREFTAARHQF